MAASRKATPSYIFDGKLIRVIDGDTAVIMVERTATAEVDFGFHIITRVFVRDSAEIHFRLNGINAADNEDVKAKKAATAALRELLADKPLRVTSLGPDKYGDRWQAIVDVDDGAGGWLNINKEMVRLGKAKAWSGAGKRPV